ncbi:unnamed protein product [Calypogeia fissa]
MLQDLRNKMAIRLQLYIIVTIAELFVSIIVHGTYALWLTCTVLFLDIVGFLTEEKQRRSSKVMPLLVSGFPTLDANTVQLSTDSSPLDEKESVTAVSSVDVHTKAPIVMVHGIFGFGKGKFGRLSYWAGAELKDDRVLVPDLGSLTSVHDRAVELFYYLKGGTVDYGMRAQHHGHLRFGRTYAQGHHREWDENHPIHVVGHSTGVQVARCLQQLLAEKAFPGYLNTNEDWILSITGLSGALNGTTRVHVEGISEEDGRSMQTLCLLQCLRICVLIYEWLDIPILKRYYSFGFDHYNLSRHKVGFKGLISLLFDQSGPFAHSNWILPDLSIHSAIKFNSRVKTYPNTYYYSHATKKTTKIWRWTLPSFFGGMHPLLFLRTWQICLWKFKIPPYEGYRDEEWKDNDGALNLKSQLFPCIPTTHPNQRWGPDLVKDGHSAKPGIWYYEVLEADHITFIIDKDRAGVKFDILYDNIFQRCRKEMQRTFGSQRETGNEMLRTVSTLSEKSLEQSFER